MKNIRKITVGLLLLSLLTVLIFGGIYKFYKVKKEKEVKNQISGGFPYNIEFKNYNIKINLAKVYEDYILFDYFITTKDNSNIEKGDVCISAEPLTPDNAYFSVTNILTEIKGNTLHSIDTCDIIARENKYEPFRYKFYISIKNLNESRDKKEVTTKEKYSLETEGYIPINKKIKFDDINFNIISLGNFDFGSLFTIFTENIDEEKCKEIFQKYSIKLKSGNFIQVYPLENWNGFNEIAIKGFSKINKKYNPNSEYDQFYISKMFYNLNEVDKNNIKVYLVNNLNNEEVQIF